MTITGSHMEKQKIRMLSDDFDVILEHMPRHPAFIRIELHRQLIFIVHDKELHRLKTDSHRLTCWLALRQNKEDRP